MAELRLTSKLFSFACYLLRHAVDFARSPPVLWRNTQAAVPFWRDTLHASNFCLRAITFGIYEKPVCRPSARTAFVLPSIPVDPEDLTWVRDELKDCLARQTIEEISPEEARRLNGAGYPISNGFVVHQGDKKRLVVNLSRQSGFFSDQSTKMETLESFALELKQSDHMFSFDIAKGYHHFRLHPDIRDWFIYKIDGRYFRCIALPFGWKLSPAYFCKLMRPMVRYVRQQLHLRIHPYMDDFLVAIRSHAKLLKAREKVGSLLVSCGLQRKVGKGCWEGARRLEHLGFMIDTKKMLFGITDARLEKLASIARQLLSQARRNRRIVDMSLLRHFCGVAISCSLAMPLSRFYTRSLYDSMKTKSWKGRRVRLVHAAIRDLKQWRDLRNRPPSRSMHSAQPTMAMHSDASTSIGSGGTLGADLRQGSPGTWEAKGLWDPVLRTKPITFLELRAVTDNLRSFTKYVSRGTHLKIWEDNMAVVYILNAMTSRSPALMEELRVLHHLLQRLGISIEAQYIPTAVNRYADRLSRLSTLDDWTINQTAIQDLLRKMEPTVDWFADAQNSLCSRFTSEFASPGSLGIDALSHHWGHEASFWNPPLKLLSLVVEKIFVEKARGLLVTPWWPAQPWCGRLLRTFQPRILEASEVYVPPAWAPSTMPPPPWRVAVWEIKPRSPVGH